MSIWRVSIYSVAKTFKSDPIGNSIQLPNALPGLKKNQFSGIDVSGMFVGEKK